MRVSVNPEIFQKPVFKYMQMVFLTPIDEKSSEKSNFSICFNGKIYSINKTSNHNDRINVEEKFRLKSNVKGFPLTMGMCMNSY